jgi:hypothetical protein
MDEQAPERFNVAGTSGRDCPTCYRIGALTGARDGDAPTLTCSGCFTAFRLTWAPDEFSRDTLTRLTPPAPARPYTPIAERGK